MPRSSSPTPRPFPVAFIARGRLGRIERAVLDVGTDSERLAIVRKALEHGQFEIVRMPGVDAEDAFSRALASKGYEGKPGDVVFEGEQALVYNRHGEFTTAAIRYIETKE